MAALKVPTLLLQAGFKHVAAVDADFSTPNVLPNPYMFPSTRRKVRTAYVVSERSSSPDPGIE